MDNMLRESLVALGKFLRLNIFCYKDGMEIFDYGSSSEYAEKIISISQREIVYRYEYKNERNFEMITTRFQETYICFSLSLNRTLYIGPFLLSEFNEFLFQVTVPAKRISPAAKKSLLTHYKNLSVYTHWYCYCLRIIVEKHLFGEVEYREDFQEIPQEQLYTLAHTQFEKNYRDTIIHTRKNDTIRSPIELENEWLYAIGIANKERAIEILQQINSLDSAIFSQDSVQSKKYSLAADCTLFTRVLIQKGISYTDAFAISDATIKTIDEITTLEQLQNFEYEMVNLFCSTIQNHKKEIYSTPVRSIIEYIEAHLSSRLTLALLSNHVFMHPGYVCTLFKKETGLSVMTYILKRRVEESKHLLLNTRESITDISNYYQFCNEAYYIRVFRKHTGTTPSRFRRNIIISDERGRK